MAYKNKATTIAYNNAYNRENYDRITIMAKKGTRDKLRKIAADRGESVNAVVLTALRERYEI